MLITSSGVSHASYYDLSRNAVELTLTSSEKEEITSLYNNMRSRMKNRQYSTIVKTIFYIPRENVKDKAVKIISKHLQDDATIWENAELVEIRKYTVTGCSSEKASYLILLKINNKPDYIKYYGPDANGNQKCYKIAPVQIFLVKINSKFYIYHYDLWHDYPSVKVVPDIEDLYERRYCD